MNLFHTRISGLPHRTKRLGAAVAEFAIVCPLLVVVLLGMIPYTSLVPDCAAAGLQKGVPCVPGTGVSVADASLHVGAPFAYAFQSAGITWAQNLILVGGVIGIASVEMVLLMGGPRVFFSLARDGLLPK